MSKSANMYVMFGLLALLFVSLGYLSMQGSREGMEDAIPPTTITIGGPATTVAKPKEKAPIIIQQQPFTGREEPKK